MLGVLYVFNQPKRPQLQDIQVFPLTSNYFCQIQTNEVNTLEKGQR
jgi:hypothetical protein